MPSRPEEPPAANAGGHNDAALHSFHPVVAGWFRARYGQPSPPQALGWPLIAAGRNCLISAPTGSGKTLAAFLKCLDHLWQGGAAGASGVQVLYVSPLKALNADIERNLQEPLVGVAARAAALGVTLPEIRVGVRTGDTPARERAQMLRHPPHVLITTPESLYLILTSQRGQTTLRTVRHVIVDEIHAVLDTKRGTHLALSLERLEALCDTPPVRIGLTATVRPLERAARFLGGQGGDGRPRPVAVADAGLRKGMDLRVEAPVADMANLPDASIWPAIHRRLLELVHAHRSTLVFVNTRMAAEQAAARLCDLAGTAIARTHHGSLSAAARRLVEAELKAGRLPCLVATGTLELGIDIGAIDLVVQVESPKSAGRGLQRVGRAGHLLGASSTGRMLPKYRSDLLECAAVARAMLRGQVEESQVPENCLDVLAQQVVAMAAVAEWPVGDLFALVRRAYPYRSLTRRQLEGVLHMLAGRYNAADYGDLRPRITWDRARDVITAREGARLLAVRSGGTIPDRGLYSIYLLGSDVKLGEVDEEFGFETYPGEVFRFGTSTWRTERVTHDRIEVSPAPGMPFARLPFWKGEYRGRPAQLGRQVGQLAREVAERLEDPALPEWLQESCALNAAAAANLRSYVWDVVDALGTMPSDRQLVIEVMTDEVGAWRIAVHSPWGLPVHAAWSLVLRRRYREVLGAEVTAVYGDEGLLLRLPPVPQAPPLEPILDMTPGTAAELLMAELGQAAVFGAYFRMAAGRALLLPRHGGGRRSPLWLQRQKAKDLLDAVRRYPDFPLVLETYRECLHQVLDLPALQNLLASVQAGDTAVAVRHNEVPSPPAYGLLYNLTVTQMYEDDLPRAERTLSALALDRGLLLELLGTGQVEQLLDPRAVADVEAGLQGRTPGRRAAAAAELHDLFLRLGDLDPAEARHCCEPPEAAMGWVSELAATGLVVPLPGPAVTGCWTATEWAGDYAAAAAGEENEQLAVLRRFARSRGPFAAADPAVRYGWDAARTAARLAQLAAEGTLVQGRLTDRGPGSAGEPGLGPGPGAGPDAGIQWCDVEVLERMRRRTLQILRREVEPRHGSDFARFLWRWQRGAHPQPGLAGLRLVLAQLDGCWLPAPLWEREVLPSRVSDYEPGWLDQVLAAGEFCWVMDGARLAFFASGVPVPLQPWRRPDAAIPAATDGTNASRVVAALRQRGASFLGTLAVAAGLTPPQALAELWGLAAAGWVTNDTFAPVRARLQRPNKGSAWGSTLADSLRERREAGGSGGEGSARGSTGADSPGTTGNPSGSFAATVGHSGTAAGRRTREAALRGVLAGGTGRWSLAPWAASAVDSDRSPALSGPPNAGGAAPAATAAPDPDSEQVWRWAEVLLGRYGILSREVVLAETSAPPWSRLYPVLQRMELQGRVRRGYLITGLAGAQFALPEAVERLRAATSGGPEPRPAPPTALLLPAADPANPWGHALPIPDALPGASGGRWRFSRVPGTYVVLCDGQPVLVAEGYGRRLVPLAAMAEAELYRVLEAVTLGLRPPGRIRPARRIEVEWWGDVPIAASPAEVPLRELGFVPNHRRWVLMPR